jgi:hypothetical protein
LSGFEFLSQLASASVRPLYYGVGALLWLALIVVVVRLAALVLPERRKAPPPARWTAPRAPIAAFDRRTETPTIALLVGAAVVHRVLGYVALLGLSGRKMTGDALVAALTAWDVPNFVRIAETFYPPPEAGTIANVIVFLPLFPVLMGLFAKLTGLGTVAAGLWLNALLIPAVVVPLYRLARLDLDRAGACWVVLIGFTMPGACYFGFPYTESIFIALSATALCAARLGQWPAAGVAAGLCALARTQGWLLTPVLLVELFRQVRAGERKWSLAAAWTLTPLASAAVYLGINHAVHGSPLAFLAEQERYWHKTPAAFYQGLSNLFNPKLFKSLEAFVEFPANELFGTAVAVATLWYGARRGNLVGAAYQAASVVFWLSTGFIMSMMRYVAATVTIPVFIVQHVRARPWLLGALCLAGAAVNVYYGIRFSRNLWVAG